MKHGIPVWFCAGHIFDSYTKAETYARKRFYRTNVELAIVEGVAHLLIDLYPWRYGGEHPKFPLSDWQYETINDYTRRSYAEWVDAKLEEEAR